MQKLGYVQDRDFVLHERYGEDKIERLAGLAAELAGLKVDVICAWTTPAASAAQRASTTIPIVFTLVANPVRSGFAVSEARPGGNLTGLSNFAGELNPKRLQLLKEMAPQLSKVARLVNPENALQVQIASTMKAAAESLGLRMIDVELPSSGDLNAAFAEIVKAGAGAVFVSADTYHFGLRQQIADMALKGQIASVFPYREGAEAGGLMSYGIDNLDLCYRMARYVDKILKGAKPSDLPIEQPTRFEFVINLKTAKVLGLEIPQVLLVRADHVIN